MSVTKEFKLGNKFIGPGHPTYIVAEMSGNHGGKIEIAKDIIKAAANCGADAVKLQTYTADTITLDSDKPDFLLPQPNDWKGHKNFYDLYQEAHTPWEWHKPLFDYARELGIEIFSAPFDETAVDFLEELEVPAYKIASPEIFHVPLIEKVAQTGKPVILSTGLAELEDIERAVDVLKTNGCHQVVILKCTTAYPAPLDEANLTTIPDLSQRFNCLSGLSDHTAGLIAPITATSLGAHLIEKHFTIKSAGETVDSFFSLNEVEFAELVSSIRDVEKAIGRPTYELTDKAKVNLKGARSIYVSKDIDAGEALSRENIKVVRPGLGLHPKFFNSLIGKKVCARLEKGDRLSWDVIEQSEKDEHTNTF